MKHYYDTWATPVGDFSAAVDEKGALLATAFGDVDSLRTRYDADEIEHSPKRLAAVCREVNEYFSKKRQTFSVPMAPAGTPFQQSVWAALQRIPSGETRTYGQLAAQLGRPAASRAVGRANATNPISLLVPCHRVIGANGKLTGYAFGEPIKQKLLAHERAAK